VLTLWAGQAECLWDEAASDRGERAAGGSGGFGPVVVRSGAGDGFPGAVALRGRGDGPVGVDRWAPDDRDGDVCAVDGPQGAVSVGVSVVASGGVGLDSSAAVLSDRSVRAGGRTSRRSAS